MEVTEKNEGRVISSITQKWKVILETKISDQLKKQSLNFTSKIYCLGVVLEFTLYSLMCKSDDMDAEVFF